MLLEYEIARITGWVENRVMPPRPAAALLRNLLSSYLQAQGRQVDLRLFETFARDQFERHWTAECTDSLREIVTARAARLLYAPRHETSRVVKLRQERPAGAPRQLTVLKI